MRGLAGSASPLDILCICVVFELELNVRDILTHDLVCRIVEMDEEEEEEGREGENFNILGC